MAPPPPGRRHRRLSMSGRPAPLIGSEVAANLPWLYDKKEFEGDVEEAKRRYHHTPAPAAPAGAPSAQLGAPPPACPPVDKRLDLDRLLRPREMDNDWAEGAALFEEIDVKRNGVLEPWELQAYLRGTGISEKAVSKIFSTIDLNADGAISKFEFMRAFGTFRDEVREARSRALEREQRTARLVGGGGHQPHPTAHPEARRGSVSKEAPGEPGGTAPRRGSFSEGGGHRRRGSFSHTRVVGPDELPAGCVPRQLLVSGSRQNNFAKIVVSKRQVKQFLRLFNDMDKDGGGTIDYSEFSSHMEESPGAITGYANAIFSKMVSRQGDGSEISFATVLRAFYPGATAAEVEVMEKMAHAPVVRATHAKSAQVAMAKRIFREIDTNGDGVLDQNEFRRGMADFYPSVLELDRQFRSIDVDRSGSVDEDEFIEWFATMDDIINA